jgi:hypothetical protein
LCGESSFSNPNPNPDPNPNPTLILTLTLSLTLTLTITPTLTLTVPRDPTASSDIKASLERLARNAAASEAMGAAGRFDRDMDDVLDGSVCSDEPITVAYLESLTARSPGDTMGDGSQPLPLYFSYYFDELSVNHPIGAHKNEHKFMMCYAILNNLDQSRRKRRPYMMLITIAKHEDVVNPAIGFEGIVGRPRQLEEDPPDISSWYNQMTQLNQGITISMRMPPVDGSRRIIHREQCFVGIDLCNLADHPAREYSKIGTYS